MQKWMMSVVAGGLLSCVATAGFAAEPENKAVKARQGFFQAVVFNAGPLFGMLKGNVPYDAKRAKVAADNLKLLGMMSNGAMWSKNTDNVKLKGQTRALPEIWDDRATFNARWQDFSKATAELAAVAGSGKDAMVAKLKVMSASCGACHKAFRAKEF